MATAGFLARRVSERHTDQPGHLGDSIRALKLSIDVRWAVVQALFQGALAGSQRRRGLALLHMQESQAKPSFAEARVLLKRPIQGFSSNMKIKCG